MKFVQLLLRKKIIKIVATRCQILRLKCTKFDFGRWGNLERSPGPPIAGFQGAYFYGRGGKRGGEGAEGRGREGRVGEGRGGRDENGGERRPFW